MENHLIIIGGVAAGTKSASKARREDPDIKISLYTEENYISYSACGLPYYIQGIISDENKLIVRTSEEFKIKENIDIYLCHRVTEIKPEDSSVIVKNLETGNEFTEHYDNLLIATGSKSIIPKIPGNDLNNIFKLKSIEDGIKIKNAVKTPVKRGLTGQMEVFLEDVKNQMIPKAVIIGAGYIGLELAEALYELGMDTTIIEKSPQILNTFDPDLTHQIKTYLEEEKGIKIIVNDSVVSFNQDEQGNLSETQTQSGEKIETDLAVIAVGVKPNVEIAQQAGIELGETGAIKVNEKMQTNFENIYAAGDCAEVINRITEKPMWLPLGSTANKQGRTAAINITGGYAEFKGVLGSKVVKIFDYTAAMTGLNEKEVKDLGLDYQIAIITHRDKSGYMPDAEQITLKVIAETGTGKFLGIQGIGKGDVDKRINIIAAAITAGMTVEEFTQTDLTYAPPYSPSIDPLLIAAQVLNDKIKKGIKSISPQDLQKYLEEKKPALIADIRPSKEFAKWSLEEAKNLSIQELKELIAEENLDNIVICCEKGMKGYLESIKLKNSDYKKISFIDGGANYLKNIPEFQNKNKK